MPDTDPAAPATPPATGDPVTPPPAPPATGEPAPKPDEPLGEPGKAALQAERKRASEAEKQARDLAAKVKSYEDAQKTAEEKLAENLKAAQDRATKAETALLRRDIAARAGLPPDLADLLEGDEAAMTARAELLKGHLTTPAAPQQPRSNRPVESLQTGSGKAGGTGPVQITKEESERMSPEAITAAIKAGQMTNLLGGEPK